MNYFKNISRISGSLLGVACIALLTQVTGCSRSELGVGEGMLTFSFEENDDLTSKSASDSKKIGYILDIVDSQGDTVAHYPDHRYIFSAIKLKAGVYTVHAQDNTEIPESVGFGMPRYGGRKSVTIEAGRNTPMAMTCGIINVKVQVDAFDPVIAAKFTHYSLVIKPTLDYTGRDTLTFTQNDVDREGGPQAGWINQTAKGRFVLIFRAATQERPDKQMIYVRTIADADSADFYRFTVKMSDNSGETGSEGGAMFRLSVKTDLKEYEFPFGVKEHTRPVPVVTRADGISIREPLTTNVDARAGILKVNIRAEAGIQRLRIRHEDAAVLLPYGLPGMITLGGDNDQATDEAQRLAVAGVVEWSAGSVVGGMDAWIDFSKLANTATVAGGVLLPEGTYPVDIEVYDFDNQMMTQRISLSVARDFGTGSVLSAELVNGIPGVGAKYAYVTAKWLGDKTPEELGFQYRELGAGDDAWVTVLVNGLDVDGANKSFRGYLSGLTPAMMYEFRPSGKELVPGNTAMFTTGEWKDLPNLDFEGGEYGSFDGASGVYSPNIPGQNRFWATGNPGGKFTIIGIGLDKNVTIPVTESAARTGTALQLTSYYVDKAGVTSLASGTIYSGTFGPIASAPMNSNAQRALVHYGQPYKARPLALKGWYKYLPKVIDTDIDGHNPTLMGEMDKCRIYISLEVWGEGVTSRPSKPTVVGYGELLSGETPTDTPDALANNGYVPFEFKINYQADKLGLTPDHIVMCATCCYMSDDFCGGAGSTLYIDDFELVWDPEQLAGN